MRQENQLILGFKITAYSQKLPSHMSDKIQEQFSSMEPYYSSACWMMARHSAAAAVKRAWC